MEMHMNIGEINNVPAPSNGTETSHESALSWSPDSLNRLRKAVYQFLVDQGDHGATDQEIQEALALPNQTECPRRWELVKGGLVENSGKRRRTLSQRSAVVWTAIKPQEA